MMDRLPFLLIRKIEGELNSDVIPFICNLLWEHTIGISELQLVGQVAEY